MIAGYLMRTPNRIYFRHGLVFETSKGLKRNLLITVERITSFCARQIVCVSPSVYQKSLEYRLNRESKQLVLGKGTCTGIDTDNKFNPLLISSKKRNDLRNELDITDKDFVLAYCGRLVKDKGIVELVDAFLELNRKNSNYKLSLVGMFEERDALPEKIKQEILTNKSIIYTGFVNDDIQYYYSLMDLFIFPSYREGFGMVVLEASAMNIPVIVSKSTGCIDSIQEGVTGEYTEIDKGDIMKTVEFVISNRDMKKYGLNGREFVVNNFKDVDVWQEIEKMY
jgi:glycosyltransferase involved in cell wall biosynthesis